MKIGFVQGLTDISATDKDGVGNLRYEGDKVYRYVQNAESATALTVGQAGFHTASGGDQTTVKVCATANLGLLAGVVMATSFTAQYYGYVQVQGVGSVSVSGATTGGTAVAAGDYLKGVNGSGHMVRDAATQPIYSRNVQVLTAVGTTTTPAAALVSCLIRALG